LIGADFTESALLLLVLVANSNLTFRENSLESCQFVVGQLGEIKAVLLATPIEDTMPSADFEHYLRRAVIALQRSFGVLQQDRAEQRELLALRPPANHHCGTQDFASLGDQIFPPCHVCLQCARLQQRAVTCIAVACRIALATSARCDESAD
jgi:hypothetical protein